MVGPSRRGLLPPIAVLSFLAFAPFSLLSIATIGAGSGVPGNALERQSRALVEQDLAVALEGLGRSEEAARHHRAAIGLDPWLKAPWVALAARALEEGSAPQAAHLAGVAVAIAPMDESARRLLEQAQAGLPPTDERRRASAPDCGPTSAGRAADESGPDRRRACLERRAGLLSSAGDAEPLIELARLDLAEDKPESAALLLTVAKTIGGGDPALLAKALALSGSPCGAEAAGGADPAWRDACAALRSRRALVEHELRADLDGLDTAKRLLAAGRIETLLGAGLDPQVAARRWRLDRRRGERGFVDLGGFTARPGQEWVPSRDPEGSGALEWHRRPGDAAIVVFAVRTDRTGADAAIRNLLTPRRPAALAWSPVTPASTDPVRAKTTALSLDADGGGRAEGTAWMIESPAAPGLALVIAAFPGTGGLGKEGLDQSRAEIQEAIAESVIVPPRWDTVTVLDAADGAEFPVPIAGGRTAPGDENASPWRTYPAGEFTVALPPGMIAAPPTGAPAASAPHRSGSVLWFRGRFRDRDGVDVAVGDEARAASIDLSSAASEEEARIRALGRGGAPEPPLSDKGAVLVSTLDITRSLGMETGAAAVSIARFRSSSPGVEWLVCRLAFGARLMEIDIPAAQGSKSIALYWIPATVRPVHGPAPPPPVDLSGRLGILFLRPPPTERREAFYKEGDLRSADFTMIVARGYTVVLDTVSPDAFPVRLTHEDGSAIVRLERLPLEAGPGADGGSGRLLAPLEDAVRAWLAREGFELKGKLVPSEDFKVSRSGAAAGVDATFTAVHARSGAQGEPASAPKGDSGQGVAGAVTAQGRGLLLQNREGSAFVLLSLCWDAQSAHRTEEIELMAGSLRLLRRKSPAPAVGQSPR